MSDPKVVKFSNDGKLMLLTTANGHVHVLDAFRGTLVSHCYFRKLLHRCFGSTGANFI